MLYTFIFYFQAVADEGEVQRLKKATVACNADPATALSEADVTNLKTGHSTDEAKAGPHLRCLGVKLNLLDSNGVVNKSNLRKVLSKDVKDESKLDEIVTQCSEPKATPEATALRVFRCLTSVRVAADHKRQELHLTT